MKNILVIGGTGFLGRHIVEQLLGSEYKVTLINRCMNNMVLFPEVDRICLDRKKIFESSAIGLNDFAKFDVVIDVNAYHPTET